MFSRFIHVEACIICLFKKYFLICLSKYTVQFITCLKFMQVESYYICLIWRFSHFSLRLWDSSMLMFIAMVHFHWCTCSVLKCTTIYVYTFLLMDIFLFPFVVIVKSAPINIPLHFSWYICARLSLKQCSPFKSKPIHRAVNRLKTDE